MATCASDYSRASARSCSAASTIRGRRTMTTLWSGRFDTAPDAEALEFGASFRFDRRLFEDDVTGSLAWARALAAAGVLSPDEALQIDATLSAMLDEARSNPDFVDGP